MEFFRIITLYLISEYLLNTNLIKRLDLEFKISLLNYLYLIRYLKYLKSTNKSRFPIQFIYGTFSFGLILGLVVTVGTTMWLVLALPPPPPFPAEPVLGAGVLCLALGALIARLKK